MYFTYKNPFPESKKIYLLNLKMMSQILPWFTSFDNKRCNQINWNHLSFIIFLSATSFISERKLSLIKLSIQSWFFCLFYYFENKHSPWTGLNSELLPMILMWFNKLIIYQNKILPRLFSAVKHFPFIETY